MKLKYPERRLRIVKLLSQNTGLFQNKTTTRFTKVAKNKKHKMHERSHLKIHINDA